MSTAVYNRDSILECFCFEKTSWRNIQELGSKKFIVKDKFQLKVFKSLHLVTSGVDFNIFIIMYTNSQVS